MFDFAESNARDFLGNSKTKAATLESRKQHQEIESIVTTMPSATEIVSMLGLEHKLVGITHECDYPNSVRRKPIVMRSVFDTKGMTSKQIDDSVLSYVTKGKSIYEIDEKLLKSLKPDLIITQELCEVCATPLREVAKIIGDLRPKPKILSLTPHDLEDVLKDVVRVGEATGYTDRAKEVMQELQSRIDTVKEKCLNSEIKPSVFCLEWMDPIYCSGHWMPEIVKYAGGKEVLGKFGEPSTVVDWEGVLNSNPDVIFVTVCGYNVRRTLKEITTLTKRNGWNDLKAVKKGRVFVLDGPSYYSRSGPRLVDGLEIMAYLLHPDLFPDYKPPKHSAYSLVSRRFI